MNCMDITNLIQDVNFIWDSDKAQSNIQKHSVTFAEAAELFFDPFYLEGDASVDGEARSFILGYSRSQRLLLVVYTDRHDAKRIISARIASRAERKIYENS